MTRSALTTLLAGALLAGCPTAECPPGYVRTGSLCQVADDASAPDSGPDAAAARDAHVPCGTTCTGAASHCLVIGRTEMCVDCRDAADCSGTTPICATASHACVGCLSAADCTDASAPICDATTMTCRPCAGSSDCGSIAGRPLCASGRCVECTVADETPCGANSCDPATGLCTTTPRHTRQHCEPCVADSECSATGVCVPMTFMGAARAGGHCLVPSMAASCAAEYSLVTEARTSLSGAAATTYCSVEESLTTCEATLDMESNRLCTTDADCGAVGLDDGFCRTNGRCSYPCTATSQCPGGFGSTCTSGHCS